MEAGILFAFVGGLLGLFSPCNAMLLPAFFAHAATSTRRLGAIGLAFLAGTLATLVPLGLGMGWLGGALAIDRGLLIVIAAWVIVAFGLLQIFGGGFDAARFLPPRVRQPRAPGSLWGAALLGTVAGVAGFCTGPVLGAILTLVLTSGSPLAGGLLLSVYGAGTVLPIIALAWAIKKYGGMRWRWMRGRQLRLGRLHLHSNTLIAGTVTLLVGVAMLLTGGLATAGELLPHDILEAISSTAANIDAAIPTWIWIALAAAGFFAWWLAEARRRLSASASARAAQSTSTKGTP
ncbi:MULTISPECIES: cytochrome c biogenesis CcdA family protein [unclassified Arthrobacter]|uniref:cytochrome c biogenesis CcdA family protein n=1 Tax=unclassified Arthrobacter TaxID=235627 RepID=UPI0015E405A0|nr:MULTISPECIES: cytochrome c biogenesis protein CcdA [unclassified Arthrobacter]